MKNVETHKLRIVEVTRDILFRKREVLFACIFGSFVEREDYQDIDVAVYLGKLQNVETLRFELFLEEELEGNLGVPFDVRVINDAPLGFVYNVLTKKILLFDRDGKLACFESLVLREYFDFRHLLEEYLREVKSAPVSS